MDLTLDDFDYHLPDGMIALEPAEPRDRSKLMVVDRHSGSISHHIFNQLPDFLTNRDVLVLNQTKVFPARLIGKKVTGGSVELLLLSQLSLNSYTAICKPGLKTGTRLFFNQTCEGSVTHVEPSGEIQIEFSLIGPALIDWIDAYGKTPLPPYINSMVTEDTMRKQYQTIFAVDRGSVAAPTAGLHFTERVVKALEDRGVMVERITLHVGLGTFQRLRNDIVHNNMLHKEPYVISSEVADRLHTAKLLGKRIIAVGTTTARALESSGKTGSITAGKQTTSIFIYPPYHFKVIDGLITNFHLPKSSLLMMVAAFISSPQTPYEFTRFESSLLGKAYQQAVEHHYRFFSFGDAMFIAG